MEWLTDEILFYGGMIAAIGSAVAAAVYYIIACVRWARLSMLFFRLKEHSICRLFFSKRSSV